MRRIKAVIIVLLLPLFALAKDYNASLFGILSDGITNNTGSIQKAIDYIHSKGGGRLVFYVGRYITGSVRLKSNVSIKLEEGAVLVGAPSIYAYSDSGKINALISAEGQEHIGISGKGVIEGNGAALVKNMQDLVQNGYIKATTQKPALLSFSGCSNVQIDSVNLWNGAGITQVFSNCKNILIDLVNIDSRHLEETGGLWVEHSSDVHLKNSFIEVTGIPIRTGENGEIDIEKTINAAGNALKSKEL